MDVCSFLFTLFLIQGLLLSQAYRFEFPGGEADVTDQSSDKISRFSKYFTYESKAVAKRLDKKRPRPQPPSPRLNPPVHFKSPPPRPPLPSPRPKAPPCFIPPPLQLLPPSPSPKYFSPPFPRPPPAGRPHGPKRCSTPPHRLPPLPPYPSPYAPKYFIPPPMVPPW